VCADSRTLLTARRRGVPTAARLAVAASSGALEDVEADLERIIDAEGGSMHPGIQQTLRFTWAHYSSTHMPLADVACLAVRGDFLHEEPVAEGLAIVHLQAPPKKRRLVGKARSGPGLRSVSWCGFFA